MKKVENWIKNHTTMHKIWGHFSSPQSMMWKAIEESNLDMLKKALDKGANPNKSNKNGKLVLHTTIAQSLGKEWIKVLLDNQANPNMFQKGESALHYALKHNSVLNSNNDEWNEIPKMLIQAGADVNIKDDENKSVLVHVVELWATNHKDKNRNMIDRTKYPDLFHIRLPIALLNSSKISSYTLSDNFDLFWDKRQVQFFLNQSIENMTLFFNLNKEIWDDYLFVPVPLSDDVSMGLWSLIRMSFAQDEDRLSIEQGFSQHPAILKMHGLPEWMILMDSLEGFSKALEWQGKLDDKDKSQLERQISVSNFGRSSLDLNNERCKCFEACLLKHQLDKTYEIRKDKPRLKQRL